MISTEQNECVSFYSLYFDSILTTNQQNPKENSFLIYSTDVNSHIKLPIIEANVGNVEFRSNVVFSLDIFSLSSDSSVFVFFSAQSKRQIKIWL